jgi:uncharacterized protein
LIVKAIAHVGIVIADAGPLIALASAELLEVTAQALSGLAAPQAVIDECTAQLDAIGATLIRNAVSRNVIAVVPNEALADLDAAFSLGLGSGEVAVLAYAKLHNALALIDERRARKIAQKIGVKTIGTGAVLVQLKRSKVITSVKPTLERWHKQGYFLSETVIKQILVAAGETGI